MSKHLEDPKEHILLRAEILARVDGLQSLNMRTLAKECGIAVGTVYNYFPTKGDLQMEIVRRFWSGLPTHLASEPPKIQATARLNQLYRLLFSYLERFRSDWLRQLAALPADERSLGREREAQFIARLRALVEDALLQDPAIPSGEWEGPITRQQTVDFLFDEMFLRLRRGEKDPAFLWAVAQRIIPTL